MSLKGNAEGSVNKYLSRNDSVQEIIRKESWGGGSLGRRYCPL
jgi:hypothetical protein